MRVTGYTYDEPMEPIREILRALLPYALQRLEIMFYNGSMC
jgi:hypothetical protein